MLNQKYVENSNVERFNMKEENEKEKIDVDIIKLFLVRIFGGSIYDYSIQKRNNELIVKCETDHFVAEFLENSICVDLKFREDIERMVFNTATQEEIKRFAPSISKTFSTALYYEFRTGVINRIKIEVRSIFNDLIYPLKEKVLRSVTEDYIRSLKIAETVGRKEK